MKIINLKGEPRTDISKASSKQLRKEEKVPCILYGGGENVAFVLDEKQFKPIVYTPDFALVDLEIDGQSSRCILKDIQFHPITDAIVHADFLRLVPGRQIKLNVPIKCDGVAEGVKSGGALQQKVRRLAIKTTPENIIHELRVNVTHLTMGQSVRVKDINVPEGVQIMNPEGIPIASVEIPRALRSATAAAELEDGEVPVEETEE